MANTPDLVTCIDGHSGPGELLPLSPFSALSYHFGMLLGVDDFETEQAYHRAKHRLHNAWLHREGVVWGFGVSVDSPQGEIRVKPGLALDPAGHELHLDADACLNVGKWFDKHEQDPDFDVETEGDGTKTFDAHVVIRFKACLTRQVPALMEPCNNAGTGTAYSRVFETVEILLLPGLAPVKKPPYHLLRLLFGLEAAETEDGGAVKEIDQDVLDALAALAALPVDEQPAALMAEFHRFAAIDGINLAPAMSEDNARTLLFPGRDDDVVVLADITAIKLKKDNQAWVLSGGDVDTSVRPSHVATTTIQDLLCGPLFGGVAPVPPLPAADGPQVDPESIVIAEYEISFNVDKDLDEESLTTASASVTCFVPTKGWQTSHINAAKYVAGTKTVILGLDDPVSGLVRLIVFGTGPSPVLGVNLVPLAGGLGGPPGTLHDGHDFVYMEEFAVAEVKPVEDQDDVPEPKYPEPEPEPEPEPDGPGESPEPEKPDEKPDDRPGPKPPEPEKPIERPGPKPPEPGKPIERPGPKQPEPEKPIERPGPKQPEPDKPIERPGPKLPEPKKPDERPGPKQPEPKKPDERPGPKRPVLVKRADRAAEKTGDKVLGNLGSTEKDKIRRPR